MVIGEVVGKEDMFSGEKFSPVLTLWKYKDFDDAIALVRDITRYSGYGHSCGIHTTNDEHMLQPCDPGAREPYDGSANPTLWQ